MSVTIVPVHLFNASRFAGFTWAADTEGTPPLGLGPPVVARGAMLGEQAVGLAVARTGSNAEARLLSLYVQRDVRRRGIGAQLLRGLEATLAGQGCDRLAVRYALGADGTAAFERTLAACAWPVPGEGERLHIFELDGQIMSAPWFTSAVLPPSHAIAPWSTVTADDRAALARSHAREPWIPECLRPEAFERDLHAPTSLVLRRDGEVVGWTLTSALHPTTIHYRNVYVRPSCNRVGRTFASLALLAEAVRRQVRLLSVRSRGRFEVAWHNVAFLRFIDRHLAKDLRSTVVLQRIVKVLPAGSARHPVQRPPATMV